MSREEMTAAVAKYEPILRQAVILQSKVAEAGMAIREASKRHYGVLLDGHLGVMGAIGHAVQRRSGQPGNTNPSVHARLNLLASIIQGVPLCETSISEGLYVQAAALLKQEMEAVAAIAEIRTNKRQDGKTPNVGGVPWNLSRLYGPLNAFAHVAKDGILTETYQMEPRGDARPVSMVPIFRPGVSKEMYGLHVALLVSTALELFEVHRELYAEEPLPEEAVQVMAAFETLKKGGFFLEAPDEAKARQEQDPT